MRHNVLILITVALVAGCAPIYLPSSPNTPMLEEQGEARISLKGGSSGGELQSAYALSDRFFLFGGVMAGSFETGEDLETSSHRYLEIGAGTMWWSTSSLVVEGAAGLGLGSGTGHARQILTGNTFSSEGAYYKPFLQGNVALRTQVVDLGLVNRLSMIQFDQITGIQGSGGEMITDPSTPLFWEPAAYVQLGSQRFRVMFLMGASGPIMGEPDFDWNPANVSIGVSYRFGGR